MRTGLLIDGDLTEEEEIKDHLTIQSFSQTTDENGVPIIVLCVNEFAPNGYIRRWAIPYPFRSKVGYKDSPEDGELENQMVIYDMDKPHMIVTGIHGNGDGTAYVSDGSVLAVYSGWNSYTDGHICYGGNDFDDAAAVLGSWMHNDSNEDLAFLGTQPMVVEVEGLESSTGIAIEWGMTPGSGDLNGLNPNIYKLWTRIKELWESEQAKHAPSQLLSALSLSREIQSSAS